MAQGYEELAGATQLECELIVKRWEEVSMKLDKMREGNKGKRPGNPLKD